MESTTAADYATFINRAQAIVADHAKTVVGWHDVVNATPLPSTVAQFCDTTTTNAAVAAAADTVRHRSCRPPTTRTWT